VAGGDAVAAHDVPPQLAARGGRLEELADLLGLLLVLAAVEAARRQREREVWDTPRAAAEMVILDECDDLVL